MRHGKAFRKLSRTSSHRMLMLRNIVSSLLEHQQIKTTVPKAKEAARLAEKMITLGKRGTTPARQRAEAFLLNPTKTIPLLFGQYAERYRERPGGYTRIHKFGYRKGDHAPHAIIELCDNPRDLQFEMVARAVGRETVQRWIHTRGSSSKFQDESSQSILDKPWIRDLTKENYKQVMKYASEERKVEFEEKAIKWANQLLAEVQHDGGLNRAVEEKKKHYGITPPRVGRQHKAGERLAGMSDRASSLGIAAGAVGQGQATQGRRSTTDVGILSNGDRIARASPKAWKSPFWEGGWKKMSKSMVDLSAPASS